MDNAGYIVAGYGATAATLVWYRWWLARRAVRARALAAALSERPARSRGNHR